MTQYPLMKNKWEHMAFGLLLFAMLLLARDTLITSCLIGFNRSQFLMLGLICLLGLAFLLRNRKRWKEILKDKRVALMGLSAAVLLIPMLLKRDWQMMYFSILLCLLFGAFLTFFTDVKTVSKCYVLGLTALGVYSLFAMYVLKPMAMEGKLVPTVFVNSAEQYFWNFGLAYVVPHGFWHRNFGIFREPGVYQFFVLLGLYLNNYEVRWKTGWQLWLVNLLLAATMVSTFSIVGFAETGLLAVFLYFDKKWYRTRPGMLAGAAAVLAGVGAVVYIIRQINTPYFEYTVFYEFYDMFVRLTTDSNSLVDRFSAIFTDLRFFGENPLLGAEIAAVLHGTEHNTSSTLILYAILGIAGGSLHVAAWVALLWRRQRCVIGNLALMAILFMSFNTQNLIADVFFWLFPYMALIQTVGNKWDEKTRRESNGA